MITRILRCCCFLCILMLLHSELIYSHTVPFFRAPDYDSGWISTVVGDGVKVTHNLGGDMDNYIVNLRFLDTNISGDIGYHNIGYGGDGATLKHGFIGAYWENLTTTDIYINRSMHDTLVDKARVRIWKNQTCENDTDWVGFESSGNQFVYQFSGSGPFADYVIVPEIRQLIYYPHNLGRNPDTYVVDLRFRIPGETNRIHYMGMGGDITEETPANYTMQGADWRLLGNMGLCVWREAYDPFAQQISFNLYSIGAMNRLDVKDHILGRHVIQGSTPLSEKADINGNGSIDIGDAILAIRCGY